MLERNQNTLKQFFQLNGQGLHTGKNVNMTAKPAPTGHGIVFIRTDLDGKPTIHALADNVVNTNRGTIIEQNKASLSTIEHFLSALAGLQVDNVCIEIDGPELPIFDGSAKFFIEAIEKAGIQEQDKALDYFEVTEPIEYIDQEKGAEILVIPDDDFKITCMIDYQTNVLNTQFAELNKIEDFKTEISNSRTFVFLHELENLIQNNLVKGGDFNNAIVFVDRLISKEELKEVSKFFHKDKVEVKSEGILNNLDLHHINEPARHKLLDVLGDITLAGKPIKGHVIAKCPGHKTNTDFAKIIRKKIKEIESQACAPHYNPDKEPLYDINQIKEILPHRSPFLLVDKILRMNKSHIVGLKNVSMNEGFFVGHFPEEPVMPGVMQVEAMAQTGGVLVLSSVDEPHLYSTYFAKFEDVRFRRKVVPGDTILFDVKLVSPIRRGLCKMVGKAYVGNALVMEATLVAQIVKNRD